MSAKHSGPKAFSAKKDRKYRRLSAIPSLLGGLAMLAAAPVLRPRVVWYVLLAAGGAMLLHTLLLFLKKKLPVWVYCLTAAVAIALTAFIPWHITLLPWYEGEYIRTSITELTLTEEPPENIVYLKHLHSLNLRGSSVRHFSTFAALKSLKHIDVRDNYAFTKKTRKAFREALPDCDILWSVPIDGQYYDSNTVTIDLREKQHTVAELKAIFEEDPDFQYLYCVDIFNQRVNESVETLTLQKPEDYDLAALQEVLTVLPQVKTIDLSVRPADFQSIQFLETVYPNITFRFTYDAPGMILKGDEQWITIAADATMEDVQGIEAFFPRLHELKAVDLRALTLTPQQVETIRSPFPDVDFIFKLKVLGVEITSENTELDLSNIKVKDVDALETVLRQLPKLKKVTMINCGVSNERMAKLRDAFPDKKIVWRVYFGKWTLRTDATAFSTLLWADRPKGWTSRDFAPLQYCTDLMFLDLGHNEITSISFIKPLTKLRILILADNNVRDLKPLAELKDLEYIELFTNYLRDLSPLAELPHLMDLNIGCNWVNSINPLCEIKTLKRLWVGNCKLSASELRKLRTSLPKCYVNTSSGNNPTGAGWRKHKHFSTIEKIHELKKYVPFSDSYPIEEE